MLKILKERKIKKIFDENPEIFSSYVKTVTINSFSEQPQTNIELKRIITVLEQEIKKIRNTQNATG